MNKFRTTTLHAQFLGIMSLLLNILKIERFNQMVRTRFLRGSINSSTSPLRFYTAEIGLTELTYHDCDPDVIHSGTRGAVDIGRLNMI